MVRRHLVLLAVDVLTVAMFVFGALAFVVSLLVGDVGLNNRAGFVLIACGPLAVLGLALDRRWNG